MKVTPKFMDGAALALNALQFGRAVIDGPRCEQERSWIFDRTNDWSAILAGTGPYTRDRRVFAPLWKTGTLVDGTEKVLAELIEFVSKRHPREPLLVYASFLSLMANTDLEGLLADLAPKVKNRLIFVARESFEEDWIDGIRRFQAAVFRQLRSRRRPPAGPVLGGFLPFRREGDESGNLEEILRLWRMAGFPPPAAWPFAANAYRGLPIPGRSPLVAFPIGYEAEMFDWEASVIEVDLPIGIEGTCSMLRKLARHLRHSGNIEKLIKAETAALYQRVRPLAERLLAGLGAVVMGDPWTAHGLSRALSDLGVDTALAAVLRRDSAQDPVLEGLRRHAGELIIDPTHADLEQKLGQLAGAGLCEVVVGSAVAVDAARRLGLAYVEISAPHYLEHFASPTPYMGFSGLAHLAERISNAVALRRHAKEHSRHGEKKK